MGKLVEHVNSMDSGDNVFSLGPLGRSITLRQMYIGLRYESWDRDMWSLTRYPSGHLSRG